MAYLATILNVMIASPSDVAEERQLVRDAIYEWNAIHSKQFGIMLNPIGWETHVAPEMSGRPQEIINKRILENSDILIGIFWTRLGSPTGEYLSGTIEEITRHGNKGKLSSIYVSKKPYPDNIDLEQLKLLRDQTNIWFKDGLLDFYNAPSTLKEKIKDHLSLHIQQNEYIKSILDETNPYNTSTLISAKKTIKTSDEMLTIIKNSGQNDGQIQFIKHLSGTSLYAGKLDMEFESGRELAIWENALHKLIELDLIKDQNNKGETFLLTNDGWKAFDQLKDQYKENE